MPCTAQLWGVTFAGKYCRDLPQGKSTFHQLRHALEKKRLTPHRSLLTLGVCHSSVYPSSSSKFDSTSLCSPESDACAQRNLVTFVFCHDCVNL